MSGARETGTAHDRRLGLHLTERSLAPRVLSALERLSYSLIPDDECDRDFETARVRLVDAQRIDDVATVDDAPDLRLLLIGSPGAVRLADPRIVDSTTRPGRLGPSLISQEREGR